MSKTAPAGCETCYSALNEIVKPQRPAGYFPLQWHAAFTGGFGNPIDDLDDFDMLRMMDAANELRRQLSEGERIACRSVSDTDLKDIGPLAFAHEDTGQLLVMGYASLGGEQVNIFIRVVDLGIPKQKNSQWISPQPIGRPRRWETLAEHLTKHYPKGRPKGVKVCDWQKIVESEVGYEMSHDLFLSARRFAYHGIQPAKSSKSPR